MPVEAKEFSAVLLAGGRSVRMGREKALLEIGEETLWRRQRGVLSALQPAELFLSVRPSQSWAKVVKGFEAVLFDALASGGPLVGITAALERMTRPWLAVLAVDMPEMTPAWFTQLLQEVEPGVGVVGRNADAFEPLAAIYPHELMPLAWEALVRGEYSLQRLLVRAVDAGMMRVRQISTEEAAFFRNWNEPVPAAGE